MMCMTSLKFRLDSLLVSLRCFVFSSKSRHLFLESVSTVTETTKFSRDRDSLVTISWWYMSVMSVSLFLSFESPEKDLFLWWAFLSLSFTLFLTTKMMSLWCIVLSDYLCIKEKCIVLFLSVHLSNQEKDTEMSQQRWWFVSRCEFSSWTKTRDSHTLLFSTQKSSSRWEERERRRWDRERKTGCQFIPLALIIYQLQKGWNEDREWNCNIHRKQSEKKRDLHARKRNANFMFERQRRWKTSREKRQEEDVSPTASFSFSCDISEVQSYSFSLPHIYLIHSLLEQDKEEQEEESNRKGRKHKTQDTQHTQWREGSQRRVRRTEKRREKKREKRKEGNHRCVTWTHSQSLSLQWDCSRWYPWLQSDKWPRLTRRVRLIPLMSKNTLWVKKNSRVIWLE